MFTSQFSPFTQFRNQKEETEPFLTLGEKFRRKRNRGHETLSVISFREKYISLCQILSPSFLSHPNPFNFTPSLSLSLCVKKRRTRKLVLVPLTRHSSLVVTFVQEEEYKTKNERTNIHPCDTRPLIFSSPTLFSPSSLSISLS